MKKLLLAAVLVGVSLSVSALDVSQPRTFSFSVDILGFFSNQLSAHVEYRFAPAYSGELGITWGYGGRKIRSDDQFLEFDPAVRAFISGVQTSYADWYLKVLGKVRFSLSNEDTLYGFGGGFGVDSLFSYALFNPEVTSEMFLDEDLRLVPRLGVGSKN
jgi:hypothetical protein